MMTKIDFATLGFLVVLATLAPLGGVSCNPATRYSHISEGAEYSETEPDNSNQAENDPLPQDRVIISPTDSLKPWNVTLHASLGDSFTLGEGQVAGIGNTGLQVRIMQFYNDPCGGEGITCVWSGVGIAIDYRFNGEIQSGIDLVKAFGFQTTIIETDHETFATFVVEELE